MFDEETNVNIVQMHLRKLFYSLLIPHRTHQITCLHKTPILWFHLKEI